MNRSYESGYQKRKKRAVAQESVKTIPKITQFFKNESGGLSSDENQSVEECIPSSISNSHDQSELVEKSDENLDQVMDVSVDVETDAPFPNVDADDPPNLRDDAGLWQNLSLTDIEHWVRKGPSDCQHSDGPFDSSRRVFHGTARQCTTNVFRGTKMNGEQYSREWLLYSPHTGNVYCFVCLLFCPGTTRFSGDGFSDWRNCNDVQSHEGNQKHRDAQLTFLVRQRQLNVSCNLTEQIDKEREYWIEVLKRVIAVIRTIAQQGIAFRGSNEKFGESHCGNFISLLELVAQFDPFLKNHIDKYGNCGSGNTSYLSKTTCDELIHLMAIKVRKSIFEDVIAAGYFSVSVDSTPDVSHIDQLTVIVRYVCSTIGLPVERFLAFLEIESHTGRYLAKTTLEYLVNGGLNFDLCRGQSYDNASNMSGIYNGMQQALLEENPFACYIPCSTHSLNLVGQSSVESCLEAVNFFGIIQAIYVFFAGSTKRWGRLDECLGPNAPTVKQLSKTRWNAHAKAVSAVSTNYDKIADTLQKIADDRDLDGDTRNQASSLVKSMEQLEFVFMMIFWRSVLHEFEKVSATLQNPSISLETCANLYTALITFVENYRDDFSDIEAKAKELVPGSDYKASTQRTRRRRTQCNDGPAPDALENLSPRDSFRIKSFLPMIDSLTTNLRQRATAYTDIAAKFSFLVNLNASKEEITESLERLIEDYPNDVNMNIVTEIQNFHNYVKQVYGNEPRKTFVELYQIIFKDVLFSAFPNVECLIRLFLTLPITNSTGERSFSALKRVKNYLRSSMCQEKVSDLGLLFIEKDKLQKLDFDDVIQQFATEKSRKKL